MPPPTAGHRRTRGRRRRVYERRRRTRRLQHQQRGGDAALDTWLSNASEIRASVPENGPVQFSTLKGTKVPNPLSLPPNNPPKIEGYIPESLGDIMSSIALRIGTTVQSGEHFAEIMKAIRGESAEVYSTIVQLEIDLQAKNALTSAPPTVVPDLTDATKRPIPFLWIALANLESAKEGQELPMLIPSKIVGDSEMIAEPPKSTAESGTTATTTTTEPAAAT